MEYLIGVVLAAVTCVFFGMLAGFDRERIFYPMMLPPVATYYILFAAGRIYAREQRFRDSLARIAHKPVEQMGGRGVRKLENIELYDDTLCRPKPNRL